MKDKTHSMNMGHSAEGAVQGFERLKPPPAGAEHKRRMEQGCLADNEALEFYENPSDGRAEPGGFLRRNNYGQRR